MIYPCFFFLPMDGVSLFIEPLQNLLSWMQKERHLRSQQKDEALVAINAAILATKKYIEESGGVKCHDRQKEYELAQIWSDAAIKARHASEDLAVRLQDKSAYWSDSFEWSSNEVFARQIDLGDIQQQVRDLLRDA
jgi:hypothetical protein